MRHQLFACYWPRQRHWMKISYAAWCTLNVMIDAHPADFEGVILARISDFT